MRRTMALVAALFLIIAGGACLLHAGEPRGELCLAHVAVTTMPGLAFMPALAGDVQPAALLAVALDRADLAPPPPRA